jgi:hypothetical protein
MKTEDFFTASQGRPLSMELVGLYFKNSEVILLIYSSQTLFTKAPHSETWCGVPYFSTEAQGLRDILSLS